MNINTDDYTGVIIRIDVQDISQNGRAAQGVRLIKLSDEQYVSTVAKVSEDDEEPADTEATTAEGSDEATDVSSEAMIEGDAPGNTSTTILRNILNINTDDYT